MTIARQAAVEAARSNAMRPRKKDLGMGITLLKVSLQLISDGCPEQCNVAMQEGLGMGMTLVKMSMFRAPIFTLDSNIASQGYAVEQPYLVKTAQVRSR